MSDACSIVEMSALEMSGHIHSKKSSDPRCINVSVEHTAFQPVLLG